MLGYLEMSDVAQSAGRCFLKTCEALASFLGCGVKMRAGQVSIAALCVCGLLIATNAQASSVVVTGSPFGKDGVVAFPGYGTSVNQNNVVGFNPSGISDPTKGAGWRAQGKTTPSSVVANVPNYAVDWYFNGAESGHAITFLSQSLTFTETNENNRYQSGNDPDWWMLGTTTGSGKGDPIPFSLIDTNAKTKLTNGANNKPDAFIASLMFAHVEPVYSKKGALKGWRVTKSATDWFAFGYDDPGSANNDHDDFMMVGHLRATPIPGALPLLGTVLGGGYLVSRWRRRQARRLRVTVS